MIYIKNQKCIYIIILEVTFTPFVFTLFGEHCAESFLWFAVILVFSINEVLFPSIFPFTCLAITLGDPVKYVVKQEYNLINYLIITQLFK